MNPRKPAYDSGWVLAALTGLLMARKGSSRGVRPGWDTRPAAPIVFAALLAAAAPMQSGHADLGTGPYL
ncbi:hypothetical protein GCM10010234_18100 [Streptomyces hawaiiensis]